MKTNLYQTIVQAAFPCKIMKKISTKKNRKKQSQPKKREKNHLHQKICTQSWQETWQNSELMRSGKNVFFNESSSLSILAIFQLIQFDFCWRRFLLNVFWWQKHVLRFPGVCMFLFFSIFCILFSEFACLLIYYLHVYTYQLLSLKK